MTWDELGKEAAGVIRTSVAALLEKHEGRIGSQSAMEAEVRAELRADVFDRLKQRGWSHEEAQVAAYVAKHLPEIRFGGPRAARD